MIRQRLADYLRLIRMDKPAGALLLLWPTLWGLWLAAEGMARMAVVWRLRRRSRRDARLRMRGQRHRRPQLRPLRRPHKDRPLAAGRISVRESAAVGAALLLCAFALWLTLPDIAKLWAVPAVAVAALYPFAKRFVALPQAVLALAFSFGIPMAFAAARDAHPPAVAWALFFANALWVMAYDTIYAMADREDDLKIGVKSSAIFFGEKDVAAVSVFYALCISWLSLIGAAMDYSFAYTSRCWPPPDLFFILPRVPRAPAGFLHVRLSRQSLFGAVVFAGFASQ